MTMTKVRATAAHGNAYGDKYQKAEGDEYEIPTTMLGTVKGVAEKVGAHEDDGENDGDAGTGSGSGAASSVDRKGSAAKGR